MKYVGWLVVLIWLTGAIGLIDVAVCVKAWTINSASLDALFRKARGNCLINDLRFHDARATALTILARRVDVLVLSRISRHKNLKMLSDVYYRVTASEIAAGL